MILYFSGTGNSEYAAKRIGKEINDEVINLFEKIRTNDFSEIHSECPWVIVVPTYAWRIPRIIENWLENTNLTGNRDIYFVMTCGENISNAGKYLKKLCAAKNWNYLGCMEVVMPENYIAMFATPAQEEALKIIRQAEDKIDQAALLIKIREAFPQPAVTFKDKISSGIVNDVFYPVFVHAKKFYATDACISCGKCVNVCPLDNVHLKNGKPVWGKDCTHCMACICRCPKEAIEYGKHSKGLPRYTCPKEAVFYQKEEISIMNIENLSTTYNVRKIETKDIESVYNLCKENTTYYEYCPPFVTIESIKTDMEILPPGKNSDDKYYIGFWDGCELIAVMDLINGYPDIDTAYIGFFMMNKKRQKQGIGSQIIKEAVAHLNAWRFSTVKLSYVKGNRQSEAFWLKNGFLQAGPEIVQELYTVIPMILEL